MPVNDFDKFRKYAPIKEAEYLGVEKNFSALIDNAEKFNLKGVQLTLLADDFFGEDKGSVSAQFMSTETHIPPHNHDFHEINYVISGKCAQYIGGRTFVLEEGDFLFMPPSVFHASAPVDDSICVNILLKSKFVSDFEKKLISYDLDNYLTRMQKQNTYMVFKAKGLLADDTAKGLTEYFKSKENQLRYHDLYAERLVEKLLLELSECESEETAFSAKRYFSTTDISAIILQYIRDNISSATRESVADHFGYSPIHLSRIIKKHTGNSFSTFILLQRMLRAEHLLTQTDISIGKIPAMIGLDSKEYFSRAFKKYNNVSPRQYRNMHK